jgi:hypothetical protein
MLVMVVRHRLAVTPGVPPCPMTALMELLSSAFDYLRAAATSLGCTIWPVAFDQWFLV